ncbi:MAG: hypothetical protein NT142_09205 [Planctomycetota bacterium]|nr:hypothetical protein [Planctomycetota bacterium]
MSWDQAVIGILIALALIGLGGWLLLPSKFPILSPTLRIFYAGHLLLLGFMLAYAQLYLENGKQPWGKSGFHPRGFGICR